MSNESNGREVTGDLILSEDRPDILCPWCGNRYTPAWISQGAVIHCGCGRAFRISSIRYSTEKVGG